jgi:release factor glutamine methyltransferase
MVMVVKAKDFLSNASELLGEIYDREEAASLVKWLLEDLANISLAGLLADQMLDSTAVKALTLAVKRLSEGTPIQHVLGYSWFMGHRFMVSGDVLIPRQETEELLDLMYNQLHQAPKNVLDIGTGSGIIPICIKKKWPGAIVTGLDISERALAVAKKNAISLQEDINWIQLDILTSRPEGSFDLIVSNPPYVLEKEKVLMHPNVLEHDPELALFVPDHDPLLFYRTIAEHAINLLSDGGHLYFEINEQFGQDIVELLASLGYSQVSMYKDLNGKDRMVRGVQGSSY